MSLLTSRISLLLWYTVRTKCHHYSQVIHATPNSTLFLLEDTESPWLWLLKWYGRFFELCFWSCSSCPSAAPSASAIIWNIMKASLHPLILKMNCIVNRWSPVIYEHLPPPSAKYLQENYSRSNSSLPSFVKITLKQLISNTYMYHALR